jgi:hypothetical protein
MKKAVLATRFMLVSCLVLRGAYVETYFWAVAQQCFQQNRHNILDHLLLLYILHLDNFL